MILQDEQNCLCGLGRMWALCVFAIFIPNSGCMLLICDG